MTQPIKNNMSELTCRLIPNVFSSKLKSRSFYTWNHLSLDIYFCHSKYVIPLVPKTKWFKSGHLHIITQLPLNQMVNVHNCGCFLVGLIRYETLVSPNENASWINNVSCLLLLRLPSVKPRNVIISCSPALPTVDDRQHSNHRMHCNQVEAIQWQQTGPTSLKSSSTNTYLNTAYCSAALAPWTLVFARVPVILLKLADVHILISAPNRPW